MEDGVLDLGIFLLNCFEDPALDAPDEEAWKGKDNDLARGFMFGVACGKIDGLELEGEETCKVSMGGSTAFFSCAPEDLVYDEAGRLHVELTLGIHQHPNC